MVNPAVFFPADISRGSTQNVCTQRDRTGLQPRAKSPFAFDYSQLFQWVLLLDLTVKISFCMHCCQSVLALFRRENLRRCVEDTRSHRVQQVSDVLQAPRPVGLDHIHVDVISQALANASRLLRFNVINVPVAARGALIFHEEANTSKRC